MDYNGEEITPSEMYKRMGPNHEVVGGYFFG